jgi:hypothetical protein
MIDPTDPKCPAARLLEEHANLVFSACHFPDEARDEIFARELWPYHLSECERCANYVGSEHYKRRIAFAERTGAFPENFLT